MRSRIEQATLSAIWSATTIVHASGLSACVAQLTAVYAAVLAKGGVRAMSAKLDSQGERRRTWEDAVASSTEDAV
eukprot:9244393-Pyramimonas_sp.AAC.1